MSYPHFKNGAWNRYNFFKTMIGFSISAGIGAATAIAINADIKKYVIAYGLWVQSLVYFVDACVIQSLPLKLN